MSEKIILNGLHTKQFVHPKEYDAIDKISKNKSIDNAITLIVDKENQMYMRMKTLGNCIRITHSNNSRICNACEDVCRILDYAYTPEIYCYRKYSLDVIPNGISEPVLVIPDLLLKIDDDDFLYFALGNAISRLKADHMKLFQAAEMLQILTQSFPFVSDAAIIAIAQWMRASNLTADRGGLLACQNYKKAMRMLMFKAGMPIEQTQNIKIIDYLKTCKPCDSLGKVGKSIKILTETNGFANDRMIELSNWYNSGAYDMLIENFE